MSEAVGTERVSAVTGYKVQKGNFNETSPNLPMRIALIGEANEANQADLSLVPTELTSAQQAGQLYGFGSPIHMAMRILRPVNGGGIGGIPVVAYPQEAADGALQKILNITPSGVATDNATHTLVVAGRRGLEGGFYDFVVSKDDTAGDLTAKISDAINAILGCPFIGTSTEYEAVATSKWAGLTADDLSITVSTNGKDVGITYVVSLVQAGSGTPEIQTSLDAFGNDWNTLLVNTYGTVSNIMDTLEAFNGVQDPLTPTGRYNAIVMKPFVALTGSVADNPSTVTDARKDQDTIAICPAPLSAAHPLEAAANMCVLEARIAQDTPHLDVQELFYPDMPVATTTIAMADYDFRDSIVKKGCSTVDIVSGKYKIRDFVTTYHPVGENPPQFRYVRSLIQDWNVFFTYYLNEQIYVVGHAITTDNTLTTASKVIKPKIWKGIVFDIADDLAKRAIITDADFMKNSVVVTISSSNPDRLGTQFDYKRSGFARISSTVATAGFNFG